MKKNDVEFVMGADLSDRVRLICGGASVRCAVAFWGTGAVDSLFPDGLGDATIVCDISMKGTPKRALLEMGAPDNPKALVRDGLHAKIYVSDRGALIGSANASNNGVGLIPGASGRLEEAGVFCPPDVQAYRDAAAAVDRIVKRATVIGPDDIARAPKRSREPQPAADLAGLSLLDTFRMAPEIFLDLSVAVVTDDDLDEEEAKRVMADHLAEFDTINPSDSPGKVFIQDDESEAIAGLRRNVLMFFMPPGKKSRWRIILYTRAILLPHKRPTFGFAFAGTHHASGTLRTLILGKKLSDSDWDAVQQVSRHNPETWAYTPEEFSDALLSAAAGGGG